jgi:alpha-galactosidase
MEKSMKKNRNAQQIKIAYIGGGSRGWAHVLMNDITQCPHLTGEIALYDQNQEMARLNVKWGQRCNKSPQAKSTWKYTVPDTLKEAMTGAHFVMASIQPGPIEFMGHDLEIPRKYGILHPVGDTVGPAGLVRSLRTVIDYEEIAKAVERYCPKAWVINFTNPMTVCTRTLYKVFPAIKAFGCCHEVFGTQRLLAQLLEEFHGIKVTRDQVRINVLGVNHFTWVDKATYNDIDLMELVARKIAQPGTIRAIPREEIEKMDIFSNRKQITYDLYLRYGILPAAGDRHLSEFVPFYLKDEPTINRWGVKLTPYSYRSERYANAPKEFEKKLRDKKPFELWQSSEEGVREMLAILGYGDFRSNVNLPNVGQIEGLARDAVVETNAYFTRDSVKPEFSGRLPAGAEALVARTVSNQELIVEAGLQRDKKLAFQAILNDALNNLPTDKAWEMFSEMLRATKASLPGWKV